MHISSLPGPFATGTVGSEARAFVRQLSDMGCAYWQILPINHITEENSPYTNRSLFALNPNFIDLPALEGEGLLTRDEVGDVMLPGGQLAPDLAILEKKKLVLLRKAYSRIGDEKRAEVAAFAQKNASWLDSYALFAVLKNVFGDACWNEWPGIGLRLHKEDAVERAFAEYENDVMFWKYVQCTAYSQWAALKRYANDLGVGIIGDIPIYASYDSSDVWACNHLFQLNTKHIPKQVAGVPPDYFNKNGQLWCNPLYDWDEMKKDGYAWWMSRLENALEIYDIVRIDHFRGFHSYWAVPYANKTAKKGSWAKGPGMDIVRKMKARFSDSSFIAEDLGDVDAAVKRFFVSAGYPGMRVMQFGFGKGGDAAHKLKNIDELCVAYTGTHDNNTIVGWCGDAPGETRDAAFAELGLPPAGAAGAAGVAGGTRASGAAGAAKASAKGSPPSDERICEAWIEALFQSQARLAIVPVQDLLHQGSESRMNFPGTVSPGNWSYRVKEGQLESIRAQWLYALNKKTKRLNKFSGTGGPGEAAGTGAKGAAGTGAASAASAGGKRAPAKAGATAKAGAGAKKGAAAAKTKTGKAEAGAKKGGAAARKG
jgi:4-alpha-glucanotransferase